MTETTEKKPFICSICGGNIDVQPGGWDRISGIRSCSKSTSGRLGFATGWPLAIGGYTQPMTENTETEHLQAARDLAMQLHIEDYAEIKRLRAALKRIADGTWSTRPRLCPPRGRRDQEKAQATSRLRTYPRVRCLQRPGLHPRFPRPATDPRGGILSADR